ncbi:MAG: transposase [Marinobacter sp.]|uniref:transposase n=1 Tax=Marinobacter sp. TaxID=50741 RepID=UPI00396DC237
MPRTQRFCPAGIPQHIVQRGNNRQVIFRGNSDQAFYTNLMKNYADEHRVSLHAWVLMDNHVHFLATPEMDKSISLFMQAIGRRYVRYFNRRYDRTGSLWEGRFRSCLVDSENYLLTCQRYIEMNPVNAGMADNPEDYWWSSYQCHGLGKSSAMHQPHPLYLELDKNPKERLRQYRQLFARPMAEKTKEIMRRTVNSGKVLGSAGFKKEIAMKYGI